MDIRKLKYILAFVLAASLGAFACGDEEDPEETTECEAPLVACGDACVDTSTNDDHCGECDNACGDGESCVDSACVGVGVGCETNDDCEAGEVCNELGECVEETEEPVACTEENFEEVCDEGQICVEGFCADEGEEPECTEETVVDDCGEGFLCVEGACVEEGEEPECTEETVVDDCGEGFLCVEGACVEEGEEPECTEETVLDDCGEGFLCVEGACVEDEGGDEV